MADIVNTVARLHHRTQSHGLDEVLLTGAHAVGHQRIEALGDGSTGACGLQLVAKLRNHLPQVLQFGGVW